MDARTHWVGVYGSKRPHEVSWFQPSPERSLAIIDSLGLGPESEVIDAGAGASTLVDGLLDRGFTRVTCLDLAGTALGAAQNRLGDRARDATWLVGDVLEESPDGPFQLWHDRAVFHFLTSPEDRARYRDTVRRVLAPGGYAVIATFAPDGPAKCSGLPVMRHDAASIARELGDGFELLREEREEHITPWNAVQRFVYAVLQRSEER